MRIALIVAATIVLLIAIYVGRAFFSPAAETISIPVTLPSEYAPKSIGLTIVVKGKESFEVDGVQTDFQRLKKLLSEKKWDEQTGLVIKRASTASFEDMLPVLDLSRQSGITRVSVE